MAITAFVEQPRVLDGDYGLACEVRNQCDLLVGERPDLPAIDANSADQLIILEHWYGEKRASPSDFHECNARWLTFRIGRFRRDVDDMDGLLRLQKPTNSVSRVRARRVSPKVLAVLWRHVLQRDGMKDAAVVAKEHAKISLAKARRLREHGLEHGLQLAWRTADHPEHFRRCGLLFQRLAEFAATRLYFAERTYVFDRDDGLVSEGFEKLDLGVGKASGLGSRHRDRSDRATVLQHWGHHDAAVVDDLRSVAILIVGVRVDIWDFLDGAAEHRASCGTPPSERNRTNASHGLDAFGCQPMRSRKMHELPVEPEHVAKLRFAQSRRALRDHVKHRLDVSRRA